MKVSENLHKLSNKNRFEMTCSPSRGFLVVWETENPKALGNSSNSFFRMVDFPTPEGPQITSGLTVVVIVRKVEMWLAWKAERLQLTEWVRNDRLETWVIKPSMNGEDNLQIDVPTSIVDLNLICILLAEK